MKTRALALVRRNFVVSTAPRHVQRHNMRQWVRSVRSLGDRWVLAKSTPLSNSST